MLSVNGSVEEVKIIFIIDEVASRLAVLNFHNLAPSIGFKIVCSQEAALVFHLLTHEIVDCAAKAFINVPNPYILLLPLYSSIISVYDSRFSVNKLLQSSMQVNSADTFFIMTVSGSSAFPSISDDCFTSVNLTFSSVNLPK